MSPAISVKGVLIEDGRVVLLENERGEWELPGGRPEPGEEPTAALVREFAEELGASVRVGRIIDCSGPLGTFSKAASPLLQGLLRTGDLRPDPLDLGLDVTADGAAIGRDGETSLHLFALGPLTKGVFWETTAVPDIRLQCERLAERILALVEAGEPVFF